jgi:hypothetical protein
VLATRLTAKTTKDRFQACPIGKENLRGIEFVQYMVLLLFVASFLCALLVPLQLKHRVLNEVSVRSKKTRIFAHGASIAYSGFELSSNNSK